MIMKTLKTESNSRWFVSSVGVALATEKSSVMLLLISAINWVGDGPVTGSSAYVDTEFGACDATGDGDIMVVESMRSGMELELATKDAISHIARNYPDFVEAIFAVDKDGLHMGRLPWIDFSILRWNFCHEGCRNLHSASLNLIFIVFMSFKQGHFVVC